ncbi:MAG: LicD family protein [Verrucomicrobia bacterium]|nr:LicD family protein [Verrucomicrobiota bacterium]
MDKIDRLFTREELPYWAGGGTLIGAIRHKGLIPWDDDLDLYILEVDEAKLKALDFDSEGLVLHYYWKDLYKIFEKEALLIPDERDPEQISPFRYPAADIFLMTLEKRREKEDMYVHRSFDFYWYWNNDRFHYSQIEDLTRVPFGPFTILIPKEPEAYLDRVYGPYWKSHALEPFWNHKTGAMAPGASLLEIDNFSPALFTP